MSSKKKKSSKTASTPSLSKEEILAESLRDAERRGLPQGWSVSYDARNRKRWTCPGPQPRSFDSFPKAMAYVRKSQDEDLEKKCISKSSLPKKRGLSSFNDLVTNTTVTADSNSCLSSSPAAGTSASKKTKRAPSKSSKNTKTKSKHSMLTESVASENNDIGNDNSNSNIHETTSSQNFPLQKQESQQQDDEIPPSSESDPETSLDLPEVSTSYNQIKYFNNQAITPTPSFSLNPYTTMQQQQHQHKPINKTVNWNPDSPAGKKVGYRIRIYDANTQSWRNGRVLRYDPCSQKHKILFFNPTILDGNDDDHIEYGEEEWINLNIDCGGGDGGSVAADVENIQVGERFVWALVKGFAWWPAQVLLNISHSGNSSNDDDCDDDSTTSAKTASHTTSNVITTKAVSNNPVSQPIREGYVLVEFFGSDEIALIKDTPDFIRPYNMGKVDASMLRRNKKKRNSQAIELGRQEQEATRVVRNEAAILYSRKAFNFANARSGGMLGQKVEFFRDDVNYPTGDVVIGTVRQYSFGMKKWLVSYDGLPTNKNIYRPSWVNLFASGYDCKLVIDSDGKGSRNKSKRNASHSCAKTIKSNKVSNYEPTELDLLPYLFGYEVSKDEEKDNYEEGFDSVVKLNGSMCRMCVEECIETERDRTFLKCSKCNGLFHTACLDPPMNQRTVEKFLKHYRNYDDGNSTTTNTTAGTGNINSNPWVCSKCTPCLGCREVDIAFGTKPHTSPPSSLYLEPGASLDLCSSCAPMYEKDMFCPVCAHTWDDVRYQRIQRRIRWQKKIKERKKKGKRRKNPTRLLCEPTNKRKKTSQLEETEEKDSHVISSSRTNDANVNISTKNDGTNTSTIEDGTKLVTTLGSNKTWISPSSLNPTWFYPDSTVWGYNEGAMIICDKCNLWVHAGCANLDQTQYDQTNRGDHPIYSNEFLCRTCCKQRCLDLVQRMQNEDKMFLFATPVTDQMAHNYNDIIQNPMDLQTLSERAHAGIYHNYAWLRESFELMVYNALTFNRARTTFWNEAHRFYYACLEKVYRIQGKGAPSSRYAALVQECFDKAERDLQAEKERVQKDDTVEKKDLVAGAQVISVKLGPLVKPIDPESCVPLTDIQLSSVDAYYSAWLECCFTCGSSGAADTMLFCVDCGEAYHSFCVMAPIHSMNQAGVSGWRCPNCKICEISGEVPKDETNLLYCEMCDRAFTLDLLDPPLKAVPPGLWICGQCVDCAHCQNHKDNGKVSRKYWSRDPKKCYQCGGCDGLSSKFLDGIACQVCKKIKRETDGDTIECKSCKSHVHIRCDTRAADVFQRRKEREKLDSKTKAEDERNKALQYSCPKCLKKITEKRKEKERSQKRPPKTTLSQMEQPREEKKIVHKGVSKIGTNVVEKAGPKVIKSKEDLQKEALIEAMKEARSRGLPEGWTVFYGAQNRKRWKSPPPRNRILDSIPKALLFAEQCKNSIKPPFTVSANVASTTNVKPDRKATKKAAKQECPNNLHTKKSRRETMKMLSLHELSIKFSEEFQWQTREMWRQEYESIIDDAEVVLSIIGEKLGKKVFILFEACSKQYLCSPFLIKRGRRYVRMMIKTNKTKRVIATRRDVRSLTVLSHMASAFLYATSLSLRLNLRDIVKHWGKMLKLLAPVDFVSGLIMVAPDEVRINECDLIIGEHEWIKQGYDDKIVGSVFGLAPEANVGSSSIRPKVIENISFDPGRAVAIALEKMAGVISKNKFISYRTGSVENVNMMSISPGKYRTIQMNAKNTSPVKFTDTSGDAINTKYQLQNTTKKSNIKKQTVTNPLNIAGVKVPTTPVRYPSTFQVYPNSATKMADAVSSISPMRCSEQNSNKPKVTIPKHTENMPGLHTKSNHTSQYLTAHTQTEKQKSRNSMTCTAKIGEQSTNKIQYSTSLSNTAKQTLPNQSPYIGGAYMKSTLQIQTSGKSPTTVNQAGLISVTNKITGTQLTSAPPMQHSKSFTNNLPQKNSNQTTHLASTLVTPTAQVKHSLSLLNTDRNASNDRTPFNAPGLSSPSVSTTQHSAKFPSNAKTYRPIPTTHNNLDVSTEQALSKQSFPNLTAHKIALSCIKSVPQVPFSTTSRSASHYNEAIPAVYNLTGTTQNFSSKQYVEADKKVMANPTTCTPVKSVPTEPRFKILLNAQKEAELKSLAQYASNAPKKLAPPVAPSTAYPIVSNKAKPNPMMYNMTGPPSALAPTVSYSTESSSASKEFSSKPKIFHTSGAPTTPAPPIKHPEILPNTGEQTAPPNASTSVAGTPMTPALPIEQSTAHSNTKKQAMLPNSLTYATGAPVTSASLTKYPTALSDVKKQSTLGNAAGAPQPSVPPTKHPTSFSNLEQQGSQRNSLTYTASASKMLAPSIPYSVSSKQTNHNATKYRKSVPIQYSDSFSKTVKQTEGNPTILKTAGAPFSSMQPVKSLITIPNSSQQPVQNKPECQLGGAKVKLTRPVENSTTSTYGEKPEPISIPYNPTMQCSTTNQSVCNLETYKETVVNMEPSSSLEYPIAILNVGSAAGPKENKNACRPMESAASVQDSKKTNSFRLQIITNNPAIVPGRSMSPISNTVNQNASYSITRSNTDAPMTSMTSTGYSTMFSSMSKHSDSNSETYNTSDSSVISNLALQHYTKRQVLPNQPKINTMNVPNTSTSLATDQEIRNQQSIAVNKLSNETLSQQTKNLGQNRLSLEKDFAGNLKENKSLLLTEYTAQNLRHVTVSATATDIRNKEGLSKIESDVVVLGKKAPSPTEIKAENGEISAVFIPEDSLNKVVNKAVSTGIVPGASCVPIVSEEIRKSSNSSQLVKDLVPLSISSKNITGEHSSNVTREVNKADNYSHHATVNNKSLGFGVGRSILPTNHNKEIFDGSGKKEVEIRKETDSNKSITSAKDIPCSSVGNTVSGRIVTKQKSDEANPKDGIPMLHNNNATCVVNSSETGSVNAKSTLIELASTKADAKLLESLQYVSTESKCDKQLPPPQTPSGKSNVVKTDLRNRAPSYSQKEQVFDTICRRQAEKKFVMQKELRPVVLDWNSKPQIKINPLIGWDSIMKSRGSEHNKWGDSRSCCLCLSCGDDDAGLPSLETDRTHNFVEEENNDSIQHNKDSHGPVGKAGRLLPIPGGLWVHAACATWSSEVWEDPETGLVNGVHKARSRGLKLKCFGCGRPGATLGCNRGNCNANYHFPCAVACGAFFTVTNQVYCAAHKSHAKDDGIVGGNFEQMKMLKVAADKQDSSQFLSVDSKLCYRAGSLVVHSLGKIEQDCDGFHCKEYITPPGYTSSRIFWSFKKAKTRTLYIMKVKRSPLKRAAALFSITAADAPSLPIEGDSPNSVYEQMMEHVRRVNKGQFCRLGNFYSVLPIERSKDSKPYGLNGPQFFGFGLGRVRRALEESPGVVACAVPLSKTSKPYEFCFLNPTEEEVKDLQRKRAAALAEKALKNASGCARSEGMSAVHKSVGSGRITRALVKRAVEEDQVFSSSTTRSSSRGQAVTESKSEIDSNQAKYREMKSVPMEYRVVAQRSHIHGWGLFAKVDIKKHAMIIEYMGEVIRQCIADKRERAYEKSGIGSCYMFRLDAQHIVDATMIGCMARFMNHCCSANAYAKVISVYTEQGLEKKIVVFANQDIQAGEEITYDYKFPVEDGSLRCTCGAPNCIGRMN